MSKILNKINEKINESNTFQNMDSIHDGITFYELLETINANVGADARKADIMKEYNKLIAMKKKDADHMMKKYIKDILQSIEIF